VGRWRIVGDASRDQGGGLVDQKVTSKFQLRRLVKGRVTAYCVQVRRSHIYVHCTYAAGGYILPMCVEEWLGTEV
jgi:hypothetical protein